MILVVLHRVGPYHQARFAAAALHLPLTVLETRPQSQEYPWRFTPQNAYPIHSFPVLGDPEQDPPLPLLDRELSSLLDRVAPRTIVSVGWADRACQRLLVAARKRRIPVVIVSDSRAADEPRFGPKEAMKRQLLRGYSAALVAGRESRAYLERLGFPPEAIFQPWDVVDNGFFSSRRSDSAPGPGASASHFLCVSRFVAKKNHAGLLEAYGHYQRRGGDWGLRLIGGGPLDRQVRSAVAALPDPGRVRIDPFLQREALVAAYGAASAVVLASLSDQWGLVVNEAIAAGVPVAVSRACGCAADLIEPEVSGWCFEPAEPLALAALLHRIERLEPAARAAVVLEARRRLECFSPVRFAVGLRQAVEWAQSHPRSSLRAQLFADLLSRRP